MRTPVFAGRMQLRHVHDVCSTTPAHDHVALGATFADLVDVFTEALEQDSLTTLLLSSLGVAGVNDGAVLAVGEARKLQIASVSNQSVRDLQMLSLSRRDAPVFDCMKSGVARTTQFHPSDVPFDPYVRECLNLGFQHEHVLPLHHHDDVHGALVLLDRHELGVNPERLSLLGSMTQVAGSLIAQSRQLEHSHNLNSQLQAALNSRVLIEQAKGIVAERMQSDMNSAFQVLRQQARHEGRVLVDVAKDIINQRETVMHTTNNRNNSTIGGSK